MADPLVVVSSGTVRGVRNGAVESFFSIPYAAPPVGGRRFALPEPALPWDGDRDCSKPGGLAPQPRRGAGRLGIDIEVPLGSGWEPGDDDYLTLNVWRPEQAEGLRPVMVWIHGGGFIMGSKDAAACNGATFARDGVICVAISYRLGVEGFLPIPGAPTNLGLRDQIAALTWVRDNIRQFGGDPDNVTIFGESAGAGSVGCLMTSPLAKGLFQRGIMQSGSGRGIELDIARRVVGKLAEHLDICADVTGFRSIPVETVLAAQTWLIETGVDLRNADGFDTSFGISRFLPVIGDDVLPEQPMAALQRGAAAELDMLAGANSDEMAVFFIPSGLQDSLTEETAVLAMGQYYPNASGILRAYGMGGSHVAPGAAFTAAVGDMLFREPVRRFAAAHRGRSYVYEFDWRSPELGGRMGASHMVDLPFVFDTLNVSQVLVGDTPPHDLSARTHALWIQFATTGQLPWSPFCEDEREVYYLAREAAIVEGLPPCTQFMPLGTPNTAAS